MAVKLFGDEQDVQYINIDVDKIPYTFRIKLRDKTFIFTIKYNDIGKFFTVDLFDSNGEILALGEIVRYGRPLFNTIEDDRFPIPIIVPLCINGTNTDGVTLDNLGSTVKLYIYERKDPK